MIKQQLSTKQQQKMSPLQIQQVKLLELNALEIEDRINHELEDNPALEEMPDSQPEDDPLSNEYEEEKTDSAEDIELGDYRNEEDIPDYQLQHSRYAAEERNVEIPYSESESFQDYLLEQVRMKHLSESEYKIAEYLVGSLDEDGYLRRTPDAISDDLAFQYSLFYSPEDITRAAEIIKELDPPGVGASDLQECLLLQLKRKTKTTARTQAIQILSYLFDAFSKRQYDKIMKSLNLSENEMKEVIKEIIQLNPRPGGAWENAMETKMVQVIPDFAVEEVNGDLVFSMMDKNIPELRISRTYNEMLANKNIRKDDRMFVKQKLEAAKWFIDAIRQRYVTLEKTMLAIIEKQRDFFLSGEETDLKPMILKDVAEISGYDISTISRVSNSKYVQTNWGIFPLKFFFSEGMTTDEGEEVSTREIKVILKQCVETEDKKHPLTDDALTLLLNEKGYDIARRTVAKYRESLNIPVARLRKELE